MQEEQIKLELMDEISKHYYTWITRGLALILTLIALCVVLAVLLALIDERFALDPFGWLCDIVGSLREKIKAMGKRSRIDGVKVMAKQNGSLNTKGLGKPLILGIILAVALVVEFSPGLIGLGFSMAHPLKTAITVGVIFMDAVAFGYIAKCALKIMNKEDKVLEISSEKEKQLSDYREIILNMDAKIFGHTIKVIVSQIDRAEKKKRLFNMFLSEYFSSGEMSYNKFKSVFDSAISVIEKNINSIIRRIVIFDEVGFEEDYGKVDSNKLKKGKFSGIYGDHIDYILDMVEYTDELLDRLDELIVKLSNMDSKSSDKDKMVAMEDLQALIEQANRYYR